MRNYQKKNEQKAKHPTMAKSTLAFNDLRSDGVKQNRLQEGANEFAKTQPAAVLQQKVSATSESGTFPRQSKKNSTGLPDTLKSGIENLSGYAMDDVKVHYNSPKPAQLQAHAYAQGNQIHLASGQEKHLAHEAWHVVQQKQGRVQPTRQLKEKVNINDDEALEREADAMGAKALQAKSKDPQSHLKETTNFSNVVARYVNLNQVAELRTTGIFKGAANLFPDTNDLLISDDGTAAAGKRGDKLLYATNARKGEANHALAAAHSPIRLNKASTAKEITLPGGAPFNGSKLTKYEPQWIAKAEEPEKHQQHSGKLTELPTGCNVAALSVTGKASLTLGYDAVDAKGIQAEFQRLDALAMVKGLDVQKTTTIKERMTAYLEAKMKLRAIHEAYKKSRPDAPEAKIKVNLVNFDFNAVSGNFNTVSSDSPSYNREELLERFDYYKDSRDHWQKSLANQEKTFHLDSEHAPERKASGMDEQVDPNYGEAYSIVGGGDKFRWNYHWAGVILKTDTDNVTLENHAGVGRRDGWDIRMYGRPRPPLLVGGAKRDPKANQSFHESWKDDGFGDNPTTLRGRHVVQGKLKTKENTIPVVQRAVLLNNAQNNRVMNQAVQLFMKHVRAQNGALIQLAENPDMNVNLIFKSISGKYVGEGDTTVRAGGEQGDDQNLVEVGVTADNKAGKLAIYINIVTNGLPLVGGTATVERLVTTMAHEYGLHAERQAQVIMEMKSAKSTADTVRAIESLQHDEGGFMNEEAQHGELIDERGAGYDSYMDLIARMKTELTAKQGVTMDRLIKDDQRDQIMNSGNSFLWKMSKLKEKGLFWIG